MLKFDGWSEEQFRGSGWATHIAAPGTSVSVDLRTDGRDIDEAEKVLHLARRKLTVIVLADDEPMLPEAKAILSLCRNLE